MSEERLIEIETKVLHQEVLLEQLHQVLYQQQEKIDGLETKLMALIQKMRERKENGEELPLPHEKPPHY